MLAASLNAFFCASPIYGSAEDFTFLLNFTPCEGLTPAAKQQIGETRKKCNSDDRRQWRKQGGAVGAAASRMRAAAKQTLGAATRLSAATSFFPFQQPLWGLKGASSPFLATATTAASGGNREELLGPRPAGCERQRSRRWEPQPVGSSASKSLVVFWFSFDIKREPSALMKERSAPRTGARTISGSLLARKRELSLMEEHSPLVKSPQKGYHKEKTKEPYLCVLTSDC